MPGPDVWGPHGWKFLHYITLGYPNYPTEQDKENYRNFINYFKQVIPCVICKNHFIEHLEIYKLTDDVMSSRINFVNWGIDMHNEVNKKNNKKVLTYDEGYQEILKNCTGENCNTNSYEKIEHFKESNTNYYLISIIIILVVLLAISCFYIYSNNIKE